MKTLMIATALASGVFGFSAMSFAQSPQEALHDMIIAVCDHDALVESEKTDCHKQMSLAKTDAEKTEVRAVFEAKVRAKGAPPLPHVQPKLNLPG